MGDLLSLVQSQLRTGYKAKKVTGSASRGGLYHVVGPDDEIIRDEGGLPVGFIDKPGHSYRRNSITNLRRCGVLQPRQKRTNTSKDYHKTEHAPSPEPTELAEAVMRDPRATPRERKLAREYLGAIQRLTSTAHALQLANVRNDELGDLIRRYVSQRKERGEQIA